MGKVKAYNTNMIKKVRIVPGMGGWLLAGVEQGMEEV